jgi:hypothetical protein
MCARARAGSMAQETTNSLQPVEKRRKKMKGKHFFLSFFFFFRLELEEDCVSVWQSLTHPSNFLSI